MRIMTVAFWFELQVRRFLGFTHQLHGAFRASSISMQGLGPLFYPGVPTGMAGPLLAAWHAGAQDAQLFAQSTQIVGAPPLNQLGGRGSSTHVGGGGPSQIVGWGSAAGRVTADGFRPRTPPRFRPHRRHPYGKGDQNVKGDHKGKRPHAPTEAPPDHLYAQSDHAEEPVEPGTPDAFPAVPPSGSPDREHFLIVLREYIQANLTVSETRSLLMRAHMSHRVGVFRSHTYHLLLFAWIRFLVALV